MQLRPIQLKPDGMNDKENLQEQTMENALKINCQITIRNTFYKLMTENKKREKK